MCTVRHLTGEEIDSMKIMIVTNRDMGGQYEVNDDNATPPGSELILITEEGFAFCFDNASSELNAKELDVGLSYNELMGEFCRQGVVVRSIDTAMLLRSKDSDMMANIPHIKKAMFDYVNMYISNKNTTMTIDIATIASITGLDKKQAKTLRNQLIGKGCLQKYHSYWKITAIFCQAAKDSVTKEFAEERTDFENCVFFNKSQVKRGTLTQEKCDAAIAEFVKTIELDEFHKSRHKNATMMGYKERDCTTHRLVGIYLNPDGSEYIDLKGASEEDIQKYLDYEGEEYYTKNAEEEDDMEGYPSDNIRKTTLSSELSDKNPQTEKPNYHPGKSELKLPTSGIEGNFTGLRPEDMSGGEPPSSPTPKKKKKVVKKSAVTRKKTRKKAKK